MTALNDLDRFHLCELALDHLPQFAERAATFRQIVRERLVAHREYVNTHGLDLPEIRDWRWEKDS